MIGNEFRQGFDSSSSGLGNQNVQSLFAMEEMHDKELEEAQKDRHHCEIEERIARKTYCEAQSALIKAMARCNSLYQQREQSSTQILSLLTGDVHSRFAARMEVDSITTRVNVTKNKSLQELLELDNSLEKELEVAQECRYKCEIEERNFLRAYRRTQFALIEASDRCSYLYRKRQQSVTRSNIEFYSRCYDQFESSVGDYLNTQSRVDLDVSQPCQYERPVLFNVNQAGSDSNFRGTSNDPSTVPYQYMRGNNIDSETSSEPDSSSSDPSPNPDSNVDNKAKTKNVLDDDTQRTSLADTDQIFLLQEAKLRSELRARLGQRPFSQKVSSDIKSGQHSVERAADSSEKSELGTSNLPLPEESQLSSHGGSCIVCVFPYNNLTKKGYQEVYQGETRIEHDSFVHISLSYESACLYHHYRLYMNESRIVSSCSGIKLELGGYELFRKTWGLILILTELVESQVQNP